MTEPGEATMPDRPEKAHGDALDELVDRTSGGEPDRPEGDEED